MGATSTTRTRGTIVSSGAQKVRMPVRIMATSAARPDRMTSATSSHVRAGISPGPPAHSRFSMPVSMANLAMKPDKGGRPASRSATHPKQTPRTASAPA